MKVVERLTSTLPPQPLVGHFGLSRLLCFKEMVRVSFGGHTVPQKGQKKPALNSTNDCAKKIPLFF